MKSVLFAKPKRKEQSTAVDILAAGLIVLFVVFMLLTYMGVSKAVQVRLTYDNLAKKYLYRMESKGYLTQADEEMLRNEIKELGGTLLYSSSTSERVKYGQPVVLDICIEFPNPILYFLNKNNSLVRLFFNETELYYIQWEATAKW